MCTRVHWREKKCANERECSHMHLILFDWFISVSEDYLTVIKHADRQAHRQTGPPSLSPCYLSVLDEPWWRPLAGDPHFASAKKTTSIRMVSFQLQLRLAPALSCSLSPPHTLTHSVVVEPLSLQLASLLLHGPRWYLQHGQKWRKTESAVPSTEKTKNNYK